MNLTNLVLLCRVQTHLGKEPKLENSLLLKLLPLILVLSANKLSLVPSTSALLIKGNNRQFAHKIWPYPTFPEGGRMQSTD